MEAYTLSTTEKIDYLRQALRADAHFESLIERAERYRDKAQRATSRTTVLRAGGTNRRSLVEDSVAALVDLSRDVLIEARRLADTVRAIERSIAAVPEERARRVLRYRYLNGWKWERIAEALAVDLRHVYRLHGRALSSVQVERVM